MFELAQRQLNGGRRGTQFTCQCRAGMKVCVGKQAQQIEAIGWHILMKRKPLWRTDASMDPHVCKDPQPLWGRVPYPGRVCCNMATIIGFDNARFLASISVIPRKEFT